MKSFKIILVFILFSSIHGFSTKSLATGERALGDLGKPPDYEQTIQNFHQTLPGYDGFVNLLPESFNWKDKGVVTPAKEQGYDCGSCWAFATIGAIESKLLMRRGNLFYDLSEQQLVSCDNTSYGCCGGTSTALKFFESVFPMQEFCTGYKDYSTACKIAERTVHCSDLNRCQISSVPFYTTGYYAVDMSDNDNIKTSILNDGPAYFRFTVFSDFDSFWKKSPPGSVYLQSNGTVRDGHAVLIIGWNDKKNAWLCKNSWGEKDGPNGDGTFWIGYSGHKTNLGFAMVNTKIEPGVLPAQWLTKMWTEVWGRVPSDINNQEGWQDQLNYFMDNGCSADTLKQLGVEFYKSQAGTSPHYDNEAKVLTLYRGILNREPDIGGYQYWLDRLNSGDNYIDVAVDFFNSSEFMILAEKICKQPAYYFGSKNSAVNIKGEISQDDLQRQLYATQPGGNVNLNKKVVVRLKKTLVIPEGVTLRTLAYPKDTIYEGRNTSHYALMARLVRDCRDNNDEYPLVVLEPGAKLVNVWVDGQRGSGCDFRNASYNIQLRGGAETAVTDCKMTDTAGWINLQSLGSNENCPCISNKITNNLITLYSSGHTHINEGGRADGLHINCENALVKNNAIVDATNSAISLLNSSVTQRSKVYENTVLNSGNSAYHAFVVAPLGRAPGDPVRRFNFRGSKIKNNLVWTGPDAHIDIVISVGSKAYFGDDANIGIGAYCSGNSSGILKIRADSGIAVSGMLNTWIWGNLFDIDLINVSKCPTANVGASVSSGFASGHIQVYEDLLYNGCLGH